MTVITKANRDQYLRNRSTYYQAGWLDAERGEKSQVSDAEVGTIEEQYMYGYNESMDNQFTMDGC